MGKELYLLFITKRFISYNTNVIAYKHFIENIQWLAHQTQPNIIQTIAKLCKYNIKLTDQY